MLISWKLCAVCHHQKLPIIVMVGIANANREYFEMDVRDMARGRKPNTGLAWLALFTDPVRGLENYTELLPVPKRNGSIKLFLKWRSCIVPAGGILWPNKRKLESSFSVAALPGRMPPSIWMGPCAPIP
jgi:hypothetical protein